MTSKISHVKTPVLSLAYISEAFDTIVYPFEGERGGGK